MSKHTPGPWVHRPSPVQGRKYRCVYFSAKRDEPYCTSALLPADAVLVAAAPELLAALEQILGDWEAVDEESLVPDEINVNEHWDQARAAIAKAKGR